MRKCGGCCDRKFARAVMMRCVYRFVVTPVNVLVATVLELRNVRECVAGIILVEKF